MRRELKYPNTDYFTYFNANPKNKNTGDCVIRAICTALDKPYSEVVSDLSDLQNKEFYDSSDPKLYGKYLQQQGWIKMPQPKHDDNKKYTGIEWCEFIKFWDNDNYKRMIAHIGSGHIVAIIDGKILDTWNSSSGCIGNYWVRGGIIND